MKKKGLMKAGLLTRWRGPSFFLRDFASDDPQKGGEESQDTGNEEETDDEKDKEEGVPPEDAEVKEKEDISDNEKAEDVEGATEQQDQELPQVVAPSEDATPTTTEPATPPAAPAPLAPPAPPAPPASLAVDAVEHQTSNLSMTEGSDEEEKRSMEAIVYEWEEELEEYDEPDIYPSEKDYIWVEELEEIVEEEEVPPPPPEQPEITEGAEAPEATEEAKEGEAAAPAEEEAKEEAKPTTEAEEAEEGKEAEEQGEDVFMPGMSTEQEQEPEPEAPQKRFKTIMVRKLVERPPKIHYEPEKERHTHETSDRYTFRRVPLRLMHSFGYDSQRMANLLVLDDTTLAYMSGFVLTIFSHTTMEKTYLRCIGGACFGALASHPSRKLFAAAEKGHMPLIGIWSWPKLQLFRQLREGTNKVYASINFSPDGKLLASQGGDPDYLVTVWNWLAETPVLRVKSHAQDVYRVTFSRELAGRLTTSGLCHIKFWKMADTFTGLKLKGDIGRFGRTELSDIEGYVEMPDGKVLSGSEWGNLLVWENGLIVAELCIKTEVPCHDGIIRQALLHEGEFYTTGQDGWVKTWNFDSVDTAEINTTEESLKVPMKVIAQVLVSDGADVWSIVQDVPNSLSTSVFWFAQDGRGSIWKVDLSFLNTAKDPAIISTAHGGPIVGCQCSITTCLFASLGADGQVRVYNYITCELVAKNIYSAPGTCFLWPSTIDSEGATMVAGFADGTFRVIVLSGTPSESLPMTLNLQQVRKPHGKKLTCMDIHPDGQYFVTGGEDGNIFFFDVSKDFLPMVFVTMPDWKPVRVIQWSRDAEEKIVLAALDGGTIQEIKMPEWSEINNETSYYHVDAKLLRRIDFQSVKSVLRHNEELERQRIAEEARIAIQEEENRQRIADGLETQSEQDLRLLQEAEEQEVARLEEKPKKKWEPYIPPEPSPILLVKPSSYHDNELLLSMGKYDAGYLYVVKLEENEDNKYGEPNPQEPIDATAVPESDDIPITAIVMSNDGDWAYMGFEDGRIRVQQLDYSFDLTNMGHHWTEGVHDTVRGNITSMALDRENAILITCGNDSNCFLHSLLPPSEMENFKLTHTLMDISKKEQRTDIQDIFDPSAFTLETSKTVEKELALLAAAKRNKTAKREEIVRLRLWYCDILRRNSELPEHVRLTPVELAIHSDVDSLRQTALEQGLKQLHIEMAWETERCNLALNKLKSHYKGGVECELFVVKAFNSDLTLWSFRSPKLPWYFEEAKDLILHQRTPRRVESDVADDDLSTTGSSVRVGDHRPKRLRGMDKFVHQRLVRLWERKQKRIQRNRVWKEFLATEPKGKELREEDKAIEEARIHMGDMKLKMAKDYKVPDEKKLTEHRARKRLVYLEELMYEMKTEFNQKLLELRTQKVALIVQMTKYADAIREHQKLLEVNEILPLPLIPSMTMAENPKSYMDYSPEDIKAYKAQIKEKLKVTVSPTTQTKVKKTEAPPKRKQLGGQVYRKVSSSTRVGLKKEIDFSSSREDQGLDLGSYVETISCEPSPLEKRIQRIKHETAKYYQTYYLQKIQEVKFIFDARLKHLRHRKVKLDYLLKLADERMVLLTDEFLLAKKSVAMEASMEGRMAEANRERKECSQQMKSLNKRQEAVRKELDGCAKQRGALLQEVVQIATKTPGFEKYLVRVFNKKITKPKVRVHAGTDEGSLVGSESDESESSSDMDMDYDEDDDDDLDVDLPPPELSKEAYDQVVEIRGRRVVIDDNELASREVYDDITGQINQLKLRIGNADRELDRVKKEVEIFSKEKQQHLNNMDCTVSIKPHQLFLLENDLTNALVTEESTIKRLQNRIPELRREKRAQRRKAKEVKKNHILLQREKHKFQESLDEMSKECDKEMAKKFGVVCDPVTLENFTGDPTVKAFRKELDAMQLDNVRTMGRLGVAEKDVQNNRLQELNKQTARYLTKSELISNINGMTKGMDEELKHLPSEFEDTTTKKEIAFLKVLVTEQWENLSSLNREIMQMTSRRRQPLPPIHHSEQRRSTHPSMPRLG